MIVNWRELFWKKKFLYISRIFKSWILQERQILNCSSFILFFVIGDKKNGEVEQGDAEDHGGEPNGASIDGY